MRETAPSRARVGIARLRVNRAAAPVDVSPAHRVSGRHFARPLFLTPTDPDLPHSMDFHPTQVTDPTHLTNPTSYPTDLTKPHRPDQPDQLDRPDPPDHTGAIRRIMDEPPDSTPKG
jgi:hypothetical protein